MPSTTEMIGALEAKLGKEELRRRIDEGRRDGDGYIHTGAMKVIYRLYFEEFPESDTAKEHRP